MRIACLPRDPSPVFHDIEESTFEEKEAVQTPSEFARLPIPEKGPRSAQQEKPPPDKPSSHPKRKEKASAQKTGLVDVESSQTSIAPKYVQVIVAADFILGPTFLTEWEITHMGLEEQ